MIIFTKHAINRVKERGILKRDILKVLENPDYIKRDNKRIIANKKLNKETLEIIFVRENNKTIILTCYYLL